MVEGNNIRWYSGRYVCGQGYLAAQWTAVLLSWPRAIILSFKVLGSSMRCVVVSSSCHISSSADLRHGNGAGGRLNALLMIHDQT